jgi:hypothetical protein
VVDRPGTETAAANGGLGHIGVPPIADLDGDTSLAARTCRLHFAAARDALLREHEWNFATAWCVPAAAPEAAIGPLAIRYPLPADCVRVRFVDELTTDEWAVEAASVTDATGATIESMVLVTNAEAPSVCYTRRVETPAMWDPLFYGVFTRRLGALCAPALARDPSVGALKQREADDMLAPAKKVDSREKAPKEISRDTSWIRARRGWQRP